MVTGNTPTITMVFTPYVQLNIHNNNPNPPHVGGLNDFFWRDNNHVASDLRPRERQHLLSSSERLGCRCFHEEPKKLTRLLQKGNMEH